MSTRIEPRIAQWQDAESIRPFGIEMKVEAALRPVSAGHKSI